MIIKKEELDDIIDVDGDLDVLWRPIPYNAIKLVKEEVKEELSRKCGISVQQVRRDKSGPTLDLCFR